MLLMKMHVLDDVAGPAHLTLHLAVIRGVSSVTWAKLRGFSSCCCGAAGTFPWPMYGPNAQPPPLSMNASWEARHVTIDAEDYHFL